MTQGEHANDSAAAQQLLAARLQQAQWAMSTGDHASCVALGQRLYADANGAADLSMAADVAVLLAKDYANNLNTEMSMQWAERGLQAATVAGMAHLQAVSRVVMASIHAQEERPAQAIAAMQQALAQLDDQMSIEVRRTVFTGVGLSYGSMGMPLQALDALRRALDIALTGANALQRTRARVNVLYTAVESYDLLLTVDEPRAAQILAEALRAAAKRLTAGRQPTRASVLLPWRWHGDVPRWQVGRGTCAAVRGVRAR
jgi:tetratricopeptide (TPR) repeat protein